MGAPEEAAILFSLERVLRRHWPSVSKLTFHPAVKVLLNLPDGAWRALYPEFRNLPPNFMRVRIGVANKLFRNQVHYLSAARSFWFLAFAKYGFSLDGNVLDLGCGCGRFAHHLRDFWVAGEVFRGRYVGVDIDEEMLNWCCGHFDRRFKFLLSSDKSSSYNKAGSQRDSYTIPEPDGEFDLIFSTSLFTHLLEDNLRNYLLETYRLLKVGAFAHHTVFLADVRPSTFGGRHTFENRLGSARVESLSLPEGAVAYESAYLMDVATKVGFSEATIMQGGIQSVLLLKK